MSVNNIYYPEYTSEALVQRASDLTLQELKELAITQLDNFIENLRLYILDKIQRRVNPFSRNFSISQIKKLFIELRDGLGAELNTFNNLPFSNGILTYKSQICTAVSQWFFDMLLTDTSSGKNPLTQFYSASDFNSNMKSVILEDKFKYSSRNPDLKISKTLTAFRVIRGAKPVYQFSPQVMKFACLNSAMRILAGKDFMIYDPCSGWGGRLVGALSLLGNPLFDNKTIHYYGTDVNLNIHSQYPKLVGFWSEYIHCTENFKYVQSSIGAEEILNDVRFSSQIGNFDMALTSPPYYSAELYSSHDTQSFRRYPNYDYGENNWRDNFLRPMIQNTFELLKPGGEFWLNIADTRNSKNAEGVDFIELERDSIRIAEDIGFYLAYTYYVKMPNLLSMTQAQRRGSKKMINYRNQFVVNGKQIKVEPIFCFKKRG